MVGGFEMRWSKLRRRAENYVGRSGERSWLCQRTLVVADAGSTGQDEGERGTVEYSQVITTFIHQER